MFLAKSTKKQGLQKERMRLSAMIYLLVDFVCLTAFLRGIARTFAHFSLKTATRLEPPDERRSLFLKTRPCRPQTAILRIINKTRPSQKMRRAAFVKALLKFFRVLPLSRVSLPMRRLPAQNRWDNARKLPVFVLSSRTCPLSILFYRIIERNIQANYLELFFDSRCSCCFCLSANVCESFISWMIHFTNESRSLPSW